MALFSPSSGRIFSKPAPWMWQRLETKLVNRCPHGQLRYRLHPARPAGTSFASLPGHPRMDTRDLAMIPIALPPNPSTPTTAPKKVADNTTAGEGTSAGNTSPAGNNDPGTFADLLAREHAKKALVVKVAKDLTVVEPEAAAPGPAKPAKKKETSADQTLAALVWPGAVLTSAAVLPAASPCASAGTDTSASGDVAQGPAVSLLTGEASAFSAKDGAALALKGLGPVIPTAVTPAPREVGTPVDSKKLVAQQPPESAPAIDAPAVPPWLSGPHQGRAARRTRGTARCPGRPAPTDPRLWQATWLNQTGNRALHPEA